MDRLNKRIVAISGGNAGIGKTMAQLFAREGAQVVITGRRQNALDEAVADIGHGAIGIRADPAVLDHHTRVATEIRRRFGALDVYVANSGIIDLAPSAQVAVADYDRQFAVNTRGVFFGVQSMLPLLRDGGSIILVGSQAASEGLLYHAVYAGTKAAIAAFAHSWAIELKARRIRVNLLSPAPADTSVPIKLGIPDEERPRFLKMMSEMNPAGRFGEAEALASAALFLASDAGSLVNGTDLHVDGGMQLARPGEPSRARTRCSPFRSSDRLAVPLSL